MLEAVEPSDPELALRLAYSLGLTYYDASYVVASQEMGACLVTDDEKLRGRVRGRAEARRLLGGESAIMRFTDIG